MPVKAPPEVIEIQRSESGALRIPGAAEPEDWHTVRTALEPTEVEDYGALCGWVGWERLYRLVDRDGVERWYFGRALAEER